MPKIVNHEERRKQLAEAAWRIIRREGLEAVSVRKVAQEAGMSLGSLRHYFASQSELLAFSMKLVSDQVNRRMETAPVNGDPVHDVELLIGELMPLDEERRAEAEVWLSFVGRALADPEIQGQKLEVHHAMYDSFSRAIAYLDAAKLLKGGLDLRLETLRLHAMVDGLVVHNLIHPEEVTRGDMIQLVSYHLRSLMA